MTVPIWAAADGDADAAEWSDLGLAYIHRTLLEAMPALGTELGADRT